MQKNIVLLVITFCFSNCNSNRGNKVVTEAVNIRRTMVLDTGCYSYSDGSNTIIFNVTSVGEEVNGTLAYAFEGKDTTIGTFKGHLSRDKLFGTYTFNAEGVESTREVAFMLKDNQLIEGYGDLNETGNAFMSEDRIHYTSTMPLTKTDCGD